MAEPIAEITGNRQEKNSKPNELAQGSSPVPIQNFAGLGLSRGEASGTKNKTSNKKGSASMESRLDYACEALGFNKMTLNQIQQIDFCLDDICRIDWLCHFPNV
jgi:hypothetical protein